MREKTVQEIFWEGEFGDAYTIRNVADPLDRRPRFADILSRTTGVRSICEFGSNRGLNVQTMHAIDPTFELAAIEINTAAFEVLRRIPYVSATRSSIQEFAPGRTYDLTFTSGVLIHVNPADLPIAYRKLFDLSNRYILIIEYFSPRPVAIEYRGHHERLFKRDFAGEFIDCVGTDAIRVVDYGFIWRRLEPAWDDLTWTLLEKTSAAGQPA